MGLKCSKQDSGLILVENKRDAKGTRIGCVAGASSPGQQGR